MFQKAKRTAAALKEGKVNQGAPLSPAIREAGKGSGGAHEGLSALGGGPRPGCAPPRSTGVCWRSRFFPQLVKMSKLREKDYRQTSRVGEYSVNVDELFSSQAAK